VTRWSCSAAANMRLKASLAAASHCCRSCSRSSPGGGVEVIGVARGVKTVRGELGIHSSYHPERRTAAELHPQRGRPVMACSIIADSWRSMYSVSCRWIYPWRSREILRRRNEGGCRPLILSQCWNCCEETPAMGRKPSGCMLWCDPKTKGHDTWSRLAGSSLQQCGFVPVTFQTPQPPISPIDQPA
jgi:hypothetical protein